MAPQDGHETSLRRPLTEPDPAAEGAGDDTTPLSWTHELREIFKLAYPAAIQLLFQYAITVTNQMMAGSLGKEALAAAAIGTTYFNLMWYFLLGISTALDTLASQAYGANDRPGCLAWCVAATIVMSLIGIPMAFALFFSKAVAAVAFRQPEHIAQMVAVYCQGMIPGLWAFMYVLVVMKAMQSQNVMQPPAFVTIAMFFINIGINWAMIRVWGFAGAAYAQSVSRLLWMFLMIGALLTFGRRCIALNTPPSAFEKVGEEEEREGESSTLLPHADPAGGEAAEKVAVKGGLSTANGGSALDLGMVPENYPVTPPQKVTFKDVWAAGAAPSALLEFARLGLPGGGMMALDAGSWDITTAMAGYLGTVEVDAHTTLLNVCICSFMAAVFGVAVAATIRVGQMLGAGKYRLARLSGNLSICIAVFNMSLVTIAIFATRNVLGRLFVDDPDVVALVAKVAWLAALYQPADGLFGSSSGVLRGMGYQAYLLVNNLVGFWLVGMTSAAILAFKFEMGIAGLWVGTIAGVLVSALLNTFMLLRVDWKKEAAIAQEVKEKAMAELEEREAAVGIRPHDPEAGGGHGLVRISSQGVSIMSRSASQRGLSMAHSAESGRSFGRSMSRSISVHRSAVGMAVSLPPSASSFTRRSFSGRNTPVGTSPLVSYERTGFLEE